MADFIQMLLFFCKIVPAKEGCKGLNSHHAQPLSPPVRFGWCVDSFVVDSLGLALTLQNAICPATVSLVEAPPVLLD